MTNKLCPVPENLSPAQMEAYKSEVHGRVGLTEKENGYVLGVAADLDSVASGLNADCEKQGVALEVLRGNVYDEKRAVSALVLGLTSEKGSLYDADAKHAKTLTALNTAMDVAVGRLSHEDSDLEGENLEVLYELLGGQDMTDDKARAVNELLTKVEGGLNGDNYKEVAVVLEAVSESLKDLVDDRTFSEC